MFVLHRIILKDIRDYDILINDLSERINKVLEGIIIISLTPRIKT